MWCALVRVSGICIYLTTLEVLLTINMATSLLRVSGFRALLVQRQFIVGNSLNTKTELSGDPVKNMFLDKLKVIVLVITE